MPDLLVKILAVCGSLQARSGNHTLLQVAVATAPPGIEVVLYDRLADLPHFNPDHESAAPESVLVLRRAIAASDAVLIACPEYGHSLPGALKNGIDWVIGSGELERKIVAITAAVPGGDRGRRGLSALAQTLGAVSAEIVFGEPIVRGPDFEAEVTALVAMLAARVSSSR